MLYESAIIGNLDAHWMCSERESALVLEGRSPQHQMAIREVLAQHEDLAVILAEAQRQEPQAGVPSHADQLAEQFRIIGADRAMVHSMVKEPPSVQRVLLVFMAGMIGQDVGDRVRGALRMTPVTQRDVPRPYAYRLHRYIQTPDHLAKLLWVAVEHMPALEHTAYHLGIR